MTTDTSHAAVDEAASRHESRGDVYTANLIRALADRLDTVEAERVAAIEALRPFASPKLTTDEGDDWLTMTNKDGRLCIPDSHGLRLMGADEETGGTVQLTAGQLRRARSAAASPKRETVPVPEIRALQPVTDQRWRHKKSGGVYRIVGYCRIEATNLPAFLYQHETGGEVWARSRTEFLDGRFEKLNEPLSTTTAQSNPATGEGE